MATTWCGLVVSDDMALVEIVGPTTREAAIEDVRRALTSLVQFGDHPDPQPRGRGFVFEAVEVPTFDVRI